MKMPLTGRITSKFGNRTHPISGVKKFHNGIDIAVPVGTAVLCPADGKVTSVYFNATGGNQMVVEHSNGYRTGYAHLKSSEKAVGSKVSKGDLIAYSGNTGASTGPHLHLTVRKNGELVDPEKHLVS